MTKDEHFVPVVYLNNFGTVVVRKNKKHGFVYAMNTETGEVLDKQIPTDSICKQPFLYEAYKDGKLLSPNAIEKTFAIKIEPAWSKLIAAIETKAKISNASLEKDEFGMLIYLMIIQLLRHPHIIESGIEIAKDACKMDEESARVFTLLSCAPFIQGVNEQYQKLVQILCEQLNGMHFAIGTANDDVVVCSDYPVIWIHSIDDYGQKTLEEVYFPLTSKMVFFATRKKKSDAWFFTMSGKRIRETNMLIAQNSVSWVYSKNPFTEQQKEMFVKSDKWRFVNGRQYRIT